MIDVPSQFILLGAEFTAASDAGFSPARYYTLPTFLSGIEGERAERSVERLRLNFIILTFLFSNKFASTERGIFASSFYSDSSGLGLVTSVVAPVYKDGNVMGVIGVDVTVLDLVSDLVFDREFETSYAFIVDAAGNVVWHPALPSPEDITGPPVKIKDLEISDGFEEFVMPGLLSGTTGTAQVTKSSAVARGDATYAGFALKSRTVTFAWRPIAGTPFR